MGKNLKYNPNPYANGKVPPCSDFLGNSNPIIKNCTVLYRNLNRLFFFLSTNTDNTTNSNINIFSSSTNIQISLNTFILGLFIKLIETGYIKYNKNIKIHSNERINTFIHKTLEKQPKLIFTHVPSLSIVFSNGNAVAPLYTDNISISKLNYYILLVINRLEKNPALFFGNNSYTLEEPINLNLAGLNLYFPLC